MDTSNLRIGDIGDSSLQSGDWRAQLQAAARERMVNRIMVTVKRHLSFSGHEGLQELRKLSERFEDKIYNAATSRVHNQVSYYALLKEWLLLGSLCRIYFWDIMFNFFW